MFGVDPRRHSFATQISAVFQAAAMGRSGCGKQFAGVPCSWHSGRFRSKLCMQAFQQVDAVPAPRHLIRANAAVENIQQRLASS